MLVIAKYKEDVSWLDRVSEKYKVYDKSSDYPNFGREAETILRHIIENYNELDEYTTFLQGNPYDHSKDFTEHFNHECFIGDWDVIESDNFTHHWEKLKISEFLEDLGLEDPKEYKFKAGAQMTLHRDTIRKRPLEFYIKCRELMDKYEQAPWILERIWQLIFIL